MDNKNILVGAAAVYLGPAGADAAPAVVAADSYRTTLDGTAAWTGVGYTQSGLAVANAPTYTDVAVDQLLDAAKIFQDGMSVTLDTTFAEATLENLVIAWGQQDDTLASTGSDKTWTIDGGSLGAAPVERGLIAVANGPVVGGGNNYSERYYHAYRVISVSSSSHTLARDAATAIPVSFRALPDNNGKYGIVRDRLDYTP